MHRVEKHSVFTWDPVQAQWIHERGPEMTAPPVPPDVHAIQTYFFDPEEKEWIATVLAPRGRELAAQWHGAYKVPDQVAGRAGTRPPKAPVKKSTPFPLVGLLLVLLVVGGGAVVVAGQQSASVPVAPAASAGATAVAGADRTAGPAQAHPTGSADATPAPTGATTQAPRPVAAPTQPPAVVTPAPIAPPPAGTSVTLADGSVVTYAGPARVNIGESASMTFMVRTGGAAGTGTLLVSYGNSSTGGSKTSSGTLDQFGRITFTMPGAPIPGNYPIVVNYKGQQTQIAILRVG